VQKEITLKRRTLILTVLLVVGVVVGGFFILVGEANKHYKKECQTCSDMLVKEHFFRNFNGAIVRLSMKIKGEGYKNDFFNAIEVKDFVESVGKNDPHFIVDERVCNTIGDKNLTQMVRYGYAESLKRSKKDKSIKIFEESFFEGLEIIKEKCNTFPVQD
jgi:hypothetical protein